jgi:hypothetical protein
MKKFSIDSCTIGIIFVILVAISFGSCSKEKKPGTYRLKKDRVISIVNNTGSELKGYMLSTATGVEIQRGETSRNSFDIKISDKFKNDLEIEVVLVDKFTRIYTKTFNVPLKGTTDTPISAGDRKSEGPVTDKYKDLVAWLNEHK